MPGLLLVPRKEKMLVCFQFAFWNSFYVLHQDAIFFLRWNRMRFFFFFQRDSFKRLFTDPLVTVTLL